MLLLLLMFFSYYFGLLVINIWELRIPFALNVIDDGKFSGVRNLQTTNPFSTYRCVLTGNSLRVALRAYRCAPHYHRATPFIVYTRD